MAGRSKKKPEKEAEKRPVSVWVKLTPVDALELDRIASLFDSSRSGIVLTLMKHLFALNEDQQRGILLQQALLKKKVELQVEKLRIEKELSSVESDMNRIGIGAPKKSPTESHS